VSLDDVLGRDGLLTIGGVIAFSGVWFGLARNIADIARRARNPPTFHPLLHSAHLGRFAGWAGVGAATLRNDPWTGLLLLSTRLPATALVAVTFLQRRECRPALSRVVATLAPLLLGLSALCTGIYWLEGRLPVLRPTGTLAFLPPATALQYALNGFVVACFAAQILYALPLQIRAALDKPLGNLRWFQLGLLFNYAYTLAYSARVEEALVGRVMAGAYGAALVEQAVLVLLIERGVRRHRATRR